MSVGIILLRETIEISLLLGIFLASIKDFLYKKISILFGIILGIIISIVFGLSINYISDSFEGRGQEIFYIFILSISMCLIYINLRWIRQNIYYKKELLSNLPSQSNNKSFLIISLMISLMILREGLEIFLFIYSIIIPKKILFSSIIIESILGILAGLLAGFIFYKGLMKISQKYIFNITSWFLILLAANMSTKILNISSSIDLISFNETPLWDISKILSENSFIGRFLSCIIGYNAKPTLSEVIVYVVTILVFYKSKQYSLSVIKNN